MTVSGSSRGCKVFRYIITCEIACNVTSIPTPGDEMGRAGYNSKPSDGDEEDIQGWEDARRKQGLGTPNVEPIQPQPISFDEWRSKPWKYKGYPAFSKWMASSNDFFLVRRFGSLNARVLLFMQNRVAEKEELLCAIDTRAQQSTDDQGNSGSLRNDPRQDRTQALAELVPLLKEYSELPLRS